MVVVKSAFEAAGATSAFELKTMFEMFFDMRSNCGRDQGAIHRAPVAALAIRNRFTAARNAAHEAAAETAVLVTL
jgi:hypothetical protein